MRKKIFFSRHLKIPFESEYGMVITCLLIKSVGNEVTKRKDYKTKKCERRKREIIKKKTSSRLSLKMAFYTMNFSF